MLSISFFVFRFFFNPYDSIAAWSEVEYVIRVTVSLLNHTTVIRLLYKIYFEVFKHVNTLYGHTQNVGKIPPIKIIHSFVVMFKLAKKD